MAIWKYLSNQFEIDTRDSFLKALKLAEYTDNALHSRIADTFFSDQYTVFHPLYDTLNTEYDTWKNQKALQKGKTTTVNGLLKDLRSTKIAAWDLAVQAAGIAKGTENYVALFPQGHKPFQTGDTITRINAINTFSMGLALQIPPSPPPTHPLVILKGQVDAFYLSADTARNTQEEEISDTGSESDAVEDARVKAMNGLYALLGACMNKFADNPVLIEPLFFLELLRQHTQMFFKTTRAVTNRTHTIAERTLAPTAQVRIKNTGVTDLWFYLAHVADAHAVPGAPIPPTLVHPDTEITVAISTLGDPATHHFLMVFNPDLINNGAWEVEFL